jgi:hypothetical protein
MRLALLGFKCLHVKRSGFLTSEGKGKFGQLLN